MSERRLRASGANYDGQLRGGAFVPAIGVNDVAVFIGPGDLLVAQLNLFQMVVLLVGGVFDVVHQGIHFHHLDVLKFGIEILHFLAGIVDSVPLELSGFQGLASGHCLVQVGAGGVDLLGEQERRMNTRAGQFAKVLLSVGMYRLCS